MKGKITYLIIAVISVIALNACSSKKVEISTLKPAEVKLIRSGTKIAVVNFNNDYAGKLSSMIQTKLAQKRINDKGYLQVITREDILDILKEENLSSIDLLNKDNAMKVTGILGAQYIVSGNVDEVSDTRDYIRSQTRCVSYYRGGDCQRYERYSDLCNVVQADVQATINLVEVKTGKIVYSKSYTKGWNTDTCEYYSLSNRPNLRTGEQAANYIFEEISNDFANRITPTVYYSKIEIMQDPKIKLNKKQKQQFKKAMDYIEQNRLKKANEVFKSLDNSLNKKSYVIAYNYGMMQEALGNIKRANELYIQADNLVKDPNRLISNSIIRTNKSLNDEKTLKEQLRKQR